MDNVQPSLISITTLVSMLLIINKPPVYSSSQNNMTTETLKLPFSKIVLANKLNINLINTGLYAMVFAVRFR